jgi:2-(1,2-epoxy-1,2-dihydrophenyl)acetyl-CoA isomerase
VTTIRRVDGDTTRQELDDETGTFRVVLCAPDRLNAMSSDMYAEIRRAVVYAYAEPRVRVVVISGEGDSFATGGDLAAFRDVVADGTAEDFVRVDAYSANLPFRPMLRCPKPIVAAIDGYCLAGGLILALCSDTVIATQRSTFAVPETKVGIFDPFVTELLPRVVGLTRARHLALTAQPIDADTAGLWGIVTQVVDDALELGRALDTVTGRLRRGSPSAQARYKRGMTADISDTDIIENIRFTFGRNGREGLDAFASRRVPAWTPIDITDGI